LGVYFLWGTSNRYYDPTTDEFLSIDPDVAATDQPYVFTNDNPLNAEDPLGLSWEDFGPEGWGLINPIAFDIGANGVANVASEGAQASVELPTLEVDSSKMPNISENIREAIESGQPSVLTRTEDPVQIRVNRTTACAGFCGEGSPDEYPFASTAEGGEGAQVRGVPIEEQRIQGAVLKNFYTKYGIHDGDIFRVVVK
jgi:hypothetical protein